MRPRFRSVVRLSRTLRFLISEGAFSVALALSVTCLLVAMAHGQSLSLRSSPPGAQVHAGDVLLGTTPLTQAALPGGARSLSVTLAGHITSVLPLPIDPEDHLQLTVEMLPELPVPFGFEPSRVPQFLVGPGQAVDLIEEVERHLSLGHIESPPTPGLLASGAAALFQGLSALSARDARRRQALGDLTQHVYGPSCSHESAPQVHCELHSLASELLLEVSVAGETATTLPFPAELEACHHSLAAAYSLARATYDPGCIHLHDSQLAMLAVRGMLDSLDDRFSRYQPPADAPTYVDDAGGEVSGVGLHLGVEADGTVVVLGAMGGSPAAAGGIREGDALLSIDQQGVDLFDLPAAVEALRGPAGTSVSLTLARAQEVLAPVALVRELLPLRCTATYFFSEHRIGYLRLDSFPGAWVAAEVRQALEALLAMDCSALVLDVRGNAGGLLDQAAAVADLFIDDGVLVSTSSPLPQIHSTLEACPTSTIVPQDVLVAVMVDRGTASAAEILAGCLRDHGRATLVGERTFGKGSVQVVLPMEAGGVLVLTVGSYMLPAGSLIHGVGLTPDLEITVDRETRASLRNRSLYGKSDPRPDDPQLEATLLYARTRLGSR